MRTRESILQEHVKLALHNCKRRYHDLGFGTYGKAKTKDAESYIRAIKSKYWILGHPQINCLARIANLEIVIHPEAYESATGCKIMYTVGKVSSVIKEEAEIKHPVAMVTRQATAMPVTKSKICEGEAVLVISSEFAPKVNKNMIEKKSYNSSESVILEVIGGADSIERAKAEKSFFGKYNLVATNEVLADGKFQVIAEVVQDATTDGFVDLLWPRA
jgi:hypothetical protein